MTKRPASVEFPRKVKAAAFARANGHCEACGLKFKAGAEYDHVLPAALGGEPTLANCRAICQPCHKAKTAEDVGRVRKADRQRDRSSGANKPKASIPKPPKAERAPKLTALETHLPRRNIYRDRTSHH